MKLQAHLQQSFPTATTASDKGSRFRWEATGTELLPRLVHGDEPGAGRFSPLLLPAHQWVVLLVSSLSLLCHLPLPSA